MSDRQDIVEQLRLWSEQLKSLSRWTSGKLKFPQRITLIGEAADEIEQLRKERDEARRIAAYQYAKHSNYGDESFAMKNFFQFHKWEYLKEDGK